VTPQATQQTDELWFPKACVPIVRYYKNICFSSVAVTGSGQCCNVNRALHSLFSKLVNCEFQRSLLAAVHTILIFSGMNRNGRMEKISWTDHVRNEDVLLRVKEQRNILHEIPKRKANWIGHILRRNCLLQRVIEGKIKGGIEVTGSRGRRRRKLLDDLKEREDTLI